MDPLTDAQALADALPDGVVVADEHGQVVLVSRVATRMLGLTATPSGVRSLAEVLALSDPDGRDWVGCNTPYDGLPTRTGIPEQSWLLPDGDEVLVAAKLHRAGVGRPVEQVVVSLRSGRGRGRLDRERSDLVATVAHELRSPLTSVRGFIQSLLSRWDRLSDDQKKLMLTTVRVDADRLSRLIVELLDVARLDTGRLQLSSRDFDVVAAVRRGVEAARMGTSRRIELDPQPEDLRLFADSDKFAQVVTNLIDNAVRHGAGDVRVAVTAPGSRVIRLVVDDRGDGIPADLRRRVLTKFWTGSTHSGSGLGLYLVNGLVRAHGGTVEILDAPGGGARVQVDWPNRTQER